MSQNNLINSCDRDEGSVLMDNACEVHLTDRAARKQFHPVHSTSLPQGTKALEITENQFALRC